MTEQISVYLTQETKAQRWPDVVKAVKDRIAGGVRVIVDEKKPTRREIQNRLAQRWAGQYAKAAGHAHEYVWGMFKLDLLLPLKLADEKEHDRAVREQISIDGAVAMILACDDTIDVTPRELRVEAAYDVIRSRDIGVRLFAEWLTLIQQQAAQEGVELLSRRDELDMAMGEAA